MRRALLLALGWLFPPALALDDVGSRRFVGLLAAEAVIVFAFFFVFWGPALLGHCVLWLVAAALPRRAT